MVHVGKKKYHTPLELSRFLVSLLPEKSFTNAVDICCGSWNLLKAAKERWPEIKITGVDLDPNSINDFPEGSIAYHMDGRLFSLECIAKGNLFDLVVANPPFGKINTCLLDTKLVYYKEYQIHGHSKNRIETEMIFANAALVKPEGFLVAIVPSSLVEAETFLKVRYILLKSFLLKLVIKLPRNIFPNNETSSYIIILQKKNNLNSKFLEDNNFTRWYSIVYQNEKWHKSVELKLSETTVRNGLWVPNIISNRNSNTFDFSIYRGKISSNQFVDSGIPVFHNTAVSPENKSWKAGIRFIKDQEGLSSLPMVKRDDIILNRVGRSAGYWCIYLGEDTIVSDCLIVINSNQTKKLLQILKKYSNKGCLTQLLKGLTTKYISQKDFTAWLTSYF